MNIDKEKLDKLVIECLNNYFLCAATSISSDQLEFKAKIIICPYFEKAYEYGKEDAINYFIKRYNEIFEYYVIFLRRKNKNIKKTLDAIKELNDKFLHKNG